MVNKFFFTALIASAIYTASLGTTLKISLGIFGCTLAAWLIAKRPLTIATCAAAGIAYRIWSGGGA